MHLHKFKNRKDIIADEKAKELLMCSLEETLIPNQKVEFYSYSSTSDPFYFEDKEGNVIERIATTTFSLNGNFSILEQKRHLNLLEKTVMEMQNEFGIKPLKVIPESPNLDRKRSRTTLRIDREVYRNEVTDSLHYDEHNDTRALDNYD